MAKIGYIKVQYFITSNDLIHKKECKSLEKNDRYVILRDSLDYLIRLPNQQHWGFLRDKNIYTDLLMEAA